MIYGILGFCRWLTVCAFIISGSLALGVTMTVSGNRNGQSEAPGTYSVTVEATIIDCANKIYEFKVTAATGSGEFPARADLNGTQRISGNGGVGTIMRRQFTGNGPFIQEISVVAVFYGEVRGMWSGGNATYELLFVGQSSDLVGDVETITGTPEQVFTGLITGAPGGYAAEVLSGDAIASINANSGIYTITLKNSVTSLVRFSAASTTCQTFVPWDIEVNNTPPTYCISWNIYNGPISSDATAVDRVNVPDNYKMTQNDQDIGSKAIPWGSYTQFKVQGLATGATVTLWKEYVSREYAWDEKLGIWKKDPLEISTWSIVDTGTPTTSCSDRGQIQPTNDYTPPKVVNPIDPASPGTPPSDSPQTPTTGTGTNKKPAGGTIWNSTVIEGGSLKEETFVEGVGKLEKQLESINDKLANPPGGGGDPNAQAIGEAAASGAGSTDGEGKGNGADEAVSQVQQAFDDAKDVPSISLPSGSANMSLPFPGVGVISLDPANIDGIPQGATFAKQFIIWATSILFAWFCWSEFKEVVQTLLQARQAQGNAIIGGTGAQATALIAAAAITGILITVPLLFWGFATYEINPISDTSGPGGVALYLLFFFFPVGHFLATVAASFVVRKAGILLVAATATLIRFIVP